MPMSDEIRQHLSALCDDELHGHECQSTVEALSRDAQLREALGRYQLISDVLHNNYRTAADQQLAARVSAAITDEPTVLAPRGARRTHSRWRRAAAGFAVAASVAAVSLVGIQSLHQESPQPVAQAPQPQEYMRLQPPASLASAQPPQAVPRLDAYLVNHNEVSRAIPLIRPVSQEGQR